MKCLCRLLRSKVGFTLIELLVAMALLVLISTAFVGMYHTGFFGVSAAGSRSSNIHQRQEEIEKAILDGTSVQSELTITLTSDGTSIIVPGQIVEFTEDNVTLRTFLPANK